MWQYHGIEYSTWSVRSSMLVCMQEYHNNQYHLAVLVVVVVVRLNRILNMVCTQQHSSILHRHDSYIETCLIYRDMTHVSYISSLQRSTCWPYSVQSVACSHERSHVESDKSNTMAGKKRSNAIIQSLDALSHTHSLSLPLARTHSLTFSYTQAHGKQGEAGKRRSNATIQSLDTHTLSHTHTHSLTRSLTYTTG